MKNILLMFILATSIGCYGQSYDLKIKNAYNVVTREKQSWLNNIEIDIEKKAVVISGKGYLDIKIYNVSDNGNMRFRTESQSQVVVIDLLNDGTGKLELLTDNITIQFKYTYNN